MFSIDPRAAAGAPDRARNLAASPTLPTRQGPTDEAARLAAAFLDNQPEAIATVTGWARSVAEHRAWGFDSPDDIVQSTMLALVQNLQGGRFAGGELRPYVRRIAKNLCISSYRRLRSRGTEIALGGDGGPGLDLASSELDPERLATLREILQRLDRNCRQIISLAYGHGMNRQEIADQLGITVGATRVRLFRCLEKARHGLEPSGG